MTAILGLKFTCNVSAAYLPKVLVVSHERSGTHFVMNSLAHNFGYVANPWINLDLELGINYYSPAAFEALVTNFSGKWIKNILKSHHEFGFYADWLYKYKHEFKVIYMVRDVLPVLRSYQRFLLTAEWNEGPKVADPPLFVRTKPIGGLTRFQSRHAESMAQRWCNHVCGWLEGGQTLGSDCFLPIHYDSLNENFGETLRTLGNFLNLPMPPQLIRPDRHTNVVFPTPEPAEPLEGFELTDSDREFVNNQTRAAYELISERL